MKVFAFVAALALASVVVGFAACFHENTDFKDNTITCSTVASQECPGGTTCVHGYCNHTDDGGDDAGDDL